MKRARLRALTHLPESVSRGYSYNVEMKRARLRALTHVSLRVDEDSCVVEMKRARLRALTHNEYIFQLV